MCISFTLNFLIILSASKAAVFFAQNPRWVEAQKWFMATVLTGLAVKMVMSKAK